MFPLYDDNVRLRWPLGTVLIIALNVFVWFFVQGFGTERALARSLCLHGLIPADLLGLVPAGFQVPLGPRLACVVDGGGSWFNLVSSMFMHGGWFHIIGNMWFLWVFGDNIEDALGHARYLLFYLFCGCAAALGQGALAPSSTVPMVGASGAIAGILGAYLVWYPWARIKTFLFLGFFFTMAELPAPVFLVLWFVVQFFSGTLSLATAGAASGGVAWFAHVGGFVAGVVLAYWLRRSGRVRPTPRYAIYGE